MEHVGCEVELFLRVRRAQHAANARQVFRNRRKAERLSKDSLLEQPSRETLGKLAIANDNGSDGRLASPCIKPVRLHSALEVRGIFP